MTQHITDKTKDTVRVMVCTNGKPLTKEDKLVIKDFIAYIKDRKRRKQLAKQEIPF